MFIHPTKSVCLEQKENTEQIYKIKLSKINKETEQVLYLHHETFSTPKFSICFFFSSSLCIGGWGGEQE